MTDVASPRLRGPGLVAARPRLARLAGTYLAAVLVGGSAVLAAGGVTAPPGAGLPVALTAMQGPQAQVLNPGPPTGLTATADDGQVILSWQPPASDGGAAIIGYDVYMGTSSHGESPNPVNGALVPGTSLAVAGLAGGATYYFTAAAVNDASLRSTASAEVSVTPAAAGSKPGSPNGPTGSPGNGPAAPTGLTATAGDTAAGLSWTASAGGGPLVTYRVYVGTAPGFTLGTPVGSTSSTSVTVTGLADGTTYYFAVTAVGADGATSGASGEASARPAATVLASAEKKVPKPLILVLAAVAVGATAAALTLVARRLRRRPRSRPAVPPPDMRAGPGQGPRTETEHPPGPWWEDAFSR